MPRKSEFIKQIDGLVGKQIQKLRVAKSISTQELGDVLGISHQQINKYESGKDKISLGRLLLIAKKLKIPIEHFFKNLDKEKIQESTDHQRLCIMVVCNFMKIADTEQQEVVNDLIKTLAKKARPTLIVDDD